MDETEDVTAAVVQAVRERGVELRLDGDSAVVTIDGTTLVRPWVYAPRPARRAEGARPMPYPPGVLVLTGRMTRAAAEEARRRGDWFADAAGRMYVRAPGVLVDVGAPAAAEARPGASRATNLMSPARAQVVLCLLAWPGMTGASVRSLAATAGVSVGLVQQVLAALAADKFLTVGNGRLIHVGELLDRWAAGFGLGLGRRLELGRFVGVPSARAWADAGYTVHLGGEAAVPHDLHGGDLVLYVPELDTRTVVSAGWRRAEPGSRADIVVRRRFWTDPDLSAAPAPAGGDVRVAPLPLVYADLVTSGEPRQREVARGLREKIVGLHTR